MGKNKLLGPDAKVLNCRDLADLSGGRVAPGRFVRCGSPYEGSEEDVHTLIHSIGVRTFIDLRGAREVAGDEPESPLMRCFAELHGAQGLHVRPAGQTSGLQDPRAVAVRLPVVGSLALARLLFASLPVRSKISLVLCGCIYGRAWASGLLQRQLQPLGLLALNVHLLRAERANLVAVLDELVVRLRSGPVLLHCSAGKDRTGLVCALVLCVCGCSSRELVADYAASEWWLAELGEQLRNGLARKIGAGSHDSIEGPNAELLRAPESVMEAVLRFLELEFGGPLRYLEWAGFSREKQAHLRELLATPVTVSTGTPMRDARNLPWGDDD